MFSKRRISKKGVPAKAFVISITEQKGWSSEGYRKYDHLLEVRATDRAPFQTEIRETFLIIEPRPKEGDVLDVRYDPESLETVFMLEGDPRYDIDAMNARSAAIMRGLPESSRDGSYERAAFQAPPAGQPQAPAAGAAAASTDPLDRLERLAKLHASGILTDAEFASEKAKILGGG